MRASGVHSIVKHLLFYAVLADLCISFIAVMYILLLVAILILPGNRGVFFPWYKEEIVVVANGRDEEVTKQYGKRNGFLELISTVRI